MRGGTNFQTYVENRPNLRDPFGLESGNLNYLVPGPNGEIATNTGPPLSWPGYGDINVTVPTPLPGTVITGGVQFTDKNAYPYLGGGVGTPGVSFTYSPDTVSPGWNYGAQIGAKCFTYQRGYGGGSWTRNRGSAFTEYGGGTPGVSVSAIYVVP